MGFFLLLLCTFPTSLCNGLVLDNLNVALMLSAIHPLYFSSTLQRGNNPVRLCFSQCKYHQKMGGGRKTNPGDISRIGYKQYWLKCVMEIRQANREFEEHIKTQTTHRECIDLLAAVGTAKEILVTLEEG